MTSSMATCYVGAFGADSVSRKTIELIDEEVYRTKMQLLAGPVGLTRKQIAKRMKRAHRAIELLEERIGNSCDPSGDDYDDYED